MRSSNKSRSRNKNQNRRPNGNIVNRVFDSSGPEGKVRGTPQQIIEKYQTLARDAQLGGDRVAAENFTQHAEHYARMLNEAMREQNIRREQMEAQQQSQRREQDDAQSQQPDTQPDLASSEQPDVIQTMTGDDNQEDNGLVETPENKSSRPRREPTTRGPRAEKPRKKADSNAEQPVPAVESDPTDTSAQVAE